MSEDLKATLRGILEHNVIRINAQFARPGRGNLYPALFLRVDASVNDAHIDWLTGHIGGLEGITAIRQTFSSHPMLKEPPQHVIRIEYPYKVMSEQSYELKEDELRDLAALAFDKIATHLEMDPQILRDHLLIVPTPELARRTNAPDIPWADGLFDDPPSPDRGPGR